MGRLLHKRPNHKTVDNYILNGVEPLRYFNLPKFGAVAHNTLIASIP